MVESAQEPRAAIPLLSPRGGVPDPIDTPAGLLRATDLLAAGSGPVAIDVERASGYRYSQRAYLIQLRRAQAGTFLIDPIPFADLSTLGAAISDAEWVFHASSQDLPSLYPLGLKPQRLFDTELAGRLAGFAKVGLATLVSVLLGFELQKSHSAVDWSIRPLPADWLSYAALDVELLIDLQEALITELERQHKLDWAHEEFAAIVAAPPPTPRAEPWRHTSGIHRVRTIRGLARVKALWEVRDMLAKDQDIAPSRILPDAAIVAAAQTDPSGRGELFAIPAFAGRLVRRESQLWLTALAHVRELPEAQLPKPLQPPAGPPPDNRWPDRNPPAADRLVRVKAALSALATANNLPTENLLAPKIVRKLTWAPPEPITPETVASALTALGARNWQAQLTAPTLVTAL